MNSIEDYIAQYEHEHHNAANRILHAVGIPIIFAGIVMFFVRWPWGVALFSSGWILLFLGHKIEGNKPAFFQGPVYFLVGPLWVARELKELVFGRASKTLAKNG